MKNKNEILTMLFLDMMFIDFLIMLDETNPQIGHQAPSLTMEDFANQRG